MNKKFSAIILAGGTGSRLAPLTRAISKQLLPVYKYPMICYPIDTLMKMGIRDILIITAPDQQQMFQKTLAFIKGVNIEYAVQDQPRGLPEALIIAEEWLDGDDVVLILGDNIIISNEKITLQRNTIFSFPVQHPERYGVVTTDEDGGIKELIEKPLHTNSRDAVIGLYIFDNNACQLAKQLKPSARGELEIVDLIREADRLKKVKVKKLQGFWFDAGNHDDLLDCANLVRVIEHRRSEPLITWNT